LAASFGPYSHAVEVPEGSRLLYISGEVGVLLDGTVPEGAGVPPEGSSAAAGVAGQSAASNICRSGLDHCSHDQIIATTVAVIVAVASQPMICNADGSVNPAMADGRIVRNIIVTITGTATTPFSTALQ
jgi:hypothetical protein